MSITVPPEKPRAKLSVVCNPFFLGRHPIEGQGCGFCGVVMMHSSGRWTWCGDTAYLERADSVTAVDAVLGKRAGETVDAGLVLPVRDLMVCNRDGDGATAVAG